MQIYHDTLAGLALECALENSLFEMGFFFRYHTHRFHIRHGKAIGAQVAEDLVVKQFLFDGIVNVDVFIEEKMFLEEEHMMSRLTRQCAASRSVLFPLGHDICHLLVGQEATLLGA